MNPVYIIPLLIDLGILYVGYQTLIGAMSPAIASYIILMFGTIGLIGALYKLFVG
ncbi:hypothetical protein ACFLQI_01760 [Candidatus Undinarchaeota archaeon]